MSNETRKIIYDLLKNLMLLIVIFVALVGVSYIFNWARQGFWHMILVFVPIYCWLYLKDQHDKSQENTTGMVEIKDEEEDDE